MGTKEKLLSAALDLFYEKGYHPTTIRDISNKAKVNVSMISYHFKGKEELYMAILRKVEDNIRVFKVIDGNTKCRNLSAKKFIEITLQEIYQHPKVTYLFMNEQIITSTEKAQKVISGIQKKHFDYFCKIFTLQNNKTPLRKYDEKTIEFLYYSVFGMIKELLKREKINSNDKKNKRGFYLHDLIRYTDQLFDCFDKDCSASVAL